MIINEESMGISRRYWDLFEIDVNQNQTKESIRINRSQKESIRVNGNQ